MPTTKVGKLVGWQLGYCEGALMAVGGGAVGNSVGGGVLTVGAGTTTNVGSKVGCTEGLIVGVVVLVGVVGKKNGTLSPVVGR